MHVVFVAERDGRSVRQVAEWEFGFGDHLDELAGGQRFPAGRRGFLCGAKQDGGATERDDIGEVAGGLGGIVFDRGEARVSRVEPARLTGPDGESRLRSGQR